MHRIDSRGSVGGKFTVGNPATGQHPTIVAATWLNDLQENIAYVIEQRGIELIKGDETQLSDAIVDLVTGAVGDGSGAVPTTRQIVGAGLASGGGSLALDRTITVTKATPAEVAAGVRDDVAITPLGLVGGIGARSLQSTGYATLLGGIILQWGSTVIGGNSGLTVTLPTSFITQCFYAGVEGGVATSGAQDNPVIVTGRSAGTITLFNAQNPSVVCNWFAVGN